MVGSMTSLEGINIIKRFHFLYFRWDHSSIWWNKEKWERFIKFIFSSWVFIWQ